MLPWDPPIYLPYPSRQGSPRSCVENPPAYARVGCHLPTPTDTLSMGTRREARCLFKPETHSMYSVLGTLRELINRISYLEPSPPKSVVVINTRGACKAVHESRYNSLFPARLIRIRGSAKAGPPSKNGNAKTGKCWTVICSARIGEPIPHPWVYRSEIRSPDCERRYILASAERLPPPLLRNRHILPGSTLHVRRIVLLAFSPDLNPTSPQAKGEIAVPRVSD